MRRIMVFAVAGLLAAQAWAKPFQVAQVSDSATWVVHADLDALKATQVGGFLLEKLNTGDAANKMAAFTAIFGFDPRRTLNTITLYGKDKAPEKSVLMAEGLFDQVQLLTLLKANSTYTEQPYGTYTIHSWIDAKKPHEGRQYGSFHPGGLVLISRGDAMLKEALDVLDGKHASLDAQKAFGAALPVRAPFFMAGVDLVSAGDLNPQAQMFKQAHSGQLMLAEQNGNLTASVQLSAQDAGAASNIQAVAEGMLALARLGQDQNAQVARLAQAARISRQGNDVRLDLSSPAQEIISLIEADMARKAQSKPGAAPPAPAPAP
jgi:hypothetical protein